MRSIRSVMRLLDALATTATLAVAFGGATHRRGWVATAKPAALVSIAARAAPSAWAADPLDRAVLANIVACSLAGDYLMYREDFDTTHADAWLAGGALAFAGAHAGYLTLCHRRGGRLNVGRFVSRVAVMNETAVIVARSRPKLLSILGPYGIVLSAMSTLSADPAAAPSAPSSAKSLRIGGLLFMASDALVINRRHLLRGTGSRGIAEAFVLLTYFAAQRLLLVGCAREARQVDEARRARPTQHAD